MEDSIYCNLNFISDCKFVKTTSTYSKYFCPYHTTFFCRAEGRSENRGGGTIDNTRSFDGTGLDTISAKICPSWFQRPCFGSNYLTMCICFYSSYKSQHVPLDIGQGPLNMWTEHSNCQIHSRGRLKNPYNFADTQNFLDFF